MDIKWHLLLYIHITLCVNKEELYGYGYMGMALVGLWRVGCSFDIASIYLVVEIYLLVLSRSPLMNCTFKSQIGYNLSQ